MIQALCSNAKYGIPNLKEGYYLDDKGALCFNNGP